MDTTTRQMWQLNKYMWMSLTFLLVYIPLAYRQGVFEAPFGVVCAVYCAGIAEGGLRTWLGLRRGGNLTARASSLFNNLEIALMTVAIAISGGIHSDLWLLYFVVMMFEALYATRRSKNLLDVKMTCFYLLGTLPRQILSAYTDPLHIYARLFLSHLFFLITVSAVARRISVNNEERNLELVLLREQRATAEERARIAREVHDSLGHALVGSILRLELASRLVARDPQEAETILREEVPALRAAWNEWRDLAFHLRSWDEMTEGEDLPALLRRHSARFAERTGLRVVLRVEGELEAESQEAGGSRGSAWQLRPALSFALTRIVQEALTNVARYAHATNITITLSQPAPQEILCVIADDGQGFDVETQATGIGLVSMRERIETLGGTFSLQSAPGQGTTVRVGANDKG